MRALIPACSALAGGCFATSEPGLHSPDPAMRLEAVVEAAARHDQGAISALIPLLGSSDAAERLLAIDTLERLTGQRFGYDYAAPEYQRRLAIARWMEWDRQRRGPEVATP